MDFSLSKISFIAFAILMSLRPDIALGQEAKFKLGAILPLSGPMSKIGSEFHSGVTYAITDFTFVYQSCRKSSVKSSFSAYSELSSGNL